MALRSVEPLDEEQWAIVQAMFRRGPTEKSTAIIKAALKRVAEMKRNY